MMKREDGFFYGLELKDFVSIALAFLFAVAGFYLGWRAFVGPPLFASAIQNYTKAVHDRQSTAAVRTEQSRSQPAIQTIPGEISVGIAPEPTKEHQAGPAQPPPKPRAR